MVSERIRTHAKTVEVFIALSALTRAPLIDAAYLSFIQKRGSDISVLLFSDSRNSLENTPIAESIP